MEKTYTFDRVIRILITILVILVALYLFDLLSTVLVPFFVAVLIAYLINPLVDFVQNKMKFKNRLLSVLSSLLFVTVAITLILSLLIPSLIQEFQKAAELLNTYAKDMAIASIIPKEWVLKLGTYSNLENVKDLFTSENLQKLGTGAASLFQYLFSSLTGILLGLISVFAILLYVVFILLDYSLITEDWKNLIPSKYKANVVQIADDLEEGMESYFRAQAKIVLIVGILFAIGFKIIGLPMAIALGIFVGLLNFVPYLQLIGFVPALFFASLLCMETGTNLWLMMGLVCIIFAVVQLIQETLLTPKIMGNLTGLNPAIIMLSLSIWGALLGIVGMIIALPLTTLILSYYKRYLAQQNG